MTFSSSTVSILPCGVLLFAGPFVGLQGVCDLGHGFYCLPLEVRGGKTCSKYLMAVITRISSQSMTQTCRYLPVIGVDSKDSFIVFGADVTHPTGGRGLEDSEPSVAAVTASKDMTLGR